jgi:hypothetical protein
LCNWMDSMRRRCGNGELDHRSISSHSFFQDYVRETHTLRRRIFNVVVCGRGRDRFPMYLLATYPLGIDGEVSRIKQTKNLCN